MVLFTSFFRTRKNGKRSGAEQTPELCPSNWSHRWILMYISSDDAGMAVLLPMAWWVGIEVLNGGSNSSCCRVVIEHAGISVPTGGRQRYPSTISAFWWLCRCMVRDCLFVEHHCHWCSLISQLTSISRGRSPIRHLGKRLVAGSLSPRIDACNLELS